MEEKVKLFELKYLWWICEFFLLNILSDVINIRNSNILFKVTFLNYVSNYVFKTTI